MGCEKAPKFVPRPLRWRAPPHPLAWMGAAPFRGRAFVIPHSWPPPRVRDKRLPTTISPDGRAGRRAPWPRRRAARNGPASWPLPFAGPRGGLAGPNQLAMLRGGGHRGGGQHAWRRGPVLGARNDGVWSPILSLVMGVWRGAGGKPRRNATSSRGPRRALVVGGPLALDGDGRNGCQFTSSREIEPRKQIATEADELRELPRGRRRKELGTDLSCQGPIEEGQGPARRPGPNRLLSEQEDRARYASAPRGKLGIDPKGVWGGLGPGRRALSGHSCLFPRPGRDRAKWRRSSSLTGTMAFYREALVGERALAPDGHRAGLAPALFNRARSTVLSQPLRPSLPIGRPSAAGITLWRRWQR